MTTAFLSPFFGAGAQILSNSGVPLAGGKLYTYIAGTTTPQTTWTTQSATVANANPIILDASGRVPTGVWLTQGASYKFVITDSTGAAVGYTVDGVSGINDATYPQAAPTEWVSGSTPTYVSGTQFSVPGDQTSVYQKYRRVKTSNTAGTRYGTISAVSYGAGVTTVTLVVDSGSLDSGLSALYYGFMSATPNSLPATTASYYAGGTLGNIGIGIGTLAAMAGGNGNIAIGDSVLAIATTAANNIGIGFQVMPNVTGNANTAIGGGAGFNLGTGSGNVALGSNALPTLNNTSNNVAIGNSAMYLSLGGAGNVAVGAFAGYNSGYQTGDNNIWIGNGAKPTAGAAADANSITIGYGAVSQGSDTIVFGNSSHTDTYLFGRINIPQYASAPTYKKGAIYFDTTLNKLRVGGATAWETITSV